ncbi:MAG: hypothetical protein ACXADS_12620 [Candidatus Thorarchaeota archaeon]|jgi:hypothetical protein
MTKKKRNRPAHETGKITIKGDEYKIHDAFPNKRNAKQTAKEARIYGLGPKGTRTRAVYRDMGKNAGRLRHGVFVRIEHKPKRRRRR